MCYRKNSYQGCYPGRAFIETLILWIIHKRPLHGYEIRKHIEQALKGNYVPKPGAVYTILRRMEQKGLLISEWKKEKMGKKDRRVYNITEKGKSLLKVRLKIMKERMELLEQMVSYYESTLKESS